MRSITKLVPMMVVATVAVLLSAACGGGHPSEIRATQGLPAAPPATPGGALAPGVGGNLALSTVPGASPLQPNTQGASLGVSPQQAPAVVYPWYPALQSQTGLTVLGFGQAQAPADRAVLSVFLGAQAIAQPGTAPNSGPMLPPGTTPLPDSDVQAVVDAIKGQGVSETDISVDRGAGTATIRATVRHLDALDFVEQAVTKAAEARNLQASLSVTYSVADCASLEEAAVRAAVSDANTRVSNLAGALSVAAGSVAGAGYTVFPAACESGAVAPYPLINGQAAPTPDGQTPEVEVSASVTVTFSIK